MDKVEGLLQNLKLSEKENKGIKIGWAGSGKVRVVEPQALAKLFSEKPVFLDAMAETLRRIWCPIKGLDCKEVGENKFCFTFGQESGKRMALEGVLGSLGMICWCLKIMIQRSDWRTMSLIRSRSGCGSCGSHWV